MKQLVYTLAVICTLMVVIAGSGAFLLSKVFIAQSKVDAVAAVAKAVSLTLSEQVNLLNSMLDKMVQDPEIIDAAAQNNTDLLANALTKLEHHFPGILSIKFLLPEDNNHPSNTINMPMGYADLEMAKKTFTNDQMTAIQGDVGSGRHLAIARRIMQKGTAIGVVLVGLNYDFIGRILSATTLEKGYIELRQGELVLASAGKKRDQEKIDNSPINVANTDWQLYYENSATTNLGEFSLMVGIVLVPALAVALGFVTGYRKLSDILRQDAAWLIKALKDILTEKPLADYPIKLNEMSMVVSTLAQFKRVVNEKQFEI
jgi:phosphomannomutase / phosphoglucomutase